MIIDRLNLNHLRIFESVYRTKSMTLAADELHLTQSGVSQHIGTLEEALDLVLFDRIKHRLVPTNSAHQLYVQCAQGLNNIEQALCTITGTTKELSGRVVVGVPVEFGNNVVIGLLTEFSELHPKVTFQLKIEFAAKLNSMLLDGSVDFAFVDDLPMDDRILKQTVYHESLELCAPAGALKKISPQTKKDFESLSYIDYEEGEPILRRWFANAFGEGPISLNVRATVADARGVARFISSGFGLGVLPCHLRQELEKSSGVRFDLISLPAGAKPVANVISMASVIGRTHSRTVSSLMEWLRAKIES